MPYFWVSEEDEKAWAESGMSIAEWQNLRLREKREEALTGNPLWSVAQRWLPGVFPVFRWSQGRAEFGYLADAGKDDSFRAVLVLAAVAGQEGVDWELHVAVLADLIGRAVTAEEVSALLSGKGRQVEVRGPDLAGSLRTAADVERLATVLGELRWPRPPE